MTKRYGRNQKRKHLQRIADAERAIDTQAKTIELLRRRGEDNAEAVLAMAKVLGKHFALLPRNPITQAAIPDQLRIETTKFAGDTRHVVGNAAEVVLASLHYIDMNRVALECDSLAGMMRVTFVTPAGKWAYGMTLDAWNRAPDDWLLGSVREEIADALGHEIVRARREGGFPL